MYFNKLNTSKPPEKWTHDEWCRHVRLSTPLPNRDILLLKLESSIEKNIIMKYRKNGQKTVV